MSCSDSSAFLIWRATGAAKSPPTTSSLLAWRISARLTCTNCLWGGAGQRSLERSALAQAVEQLTRGIDLIASLPSTPALHRIEIKLQGKRDEDRKLLAPIYGWFTEGFDMLDLKEAKALLDTLVS